LGDSRSPNQFTQLLLYFRDALLKLGFLDGPELQVQERSQASGSPRAEFAGIDFADHPFDGITHCVHAVQIGQWIRSANDTAVLSSADPTEFGSLLGVGMKETESAFACGGPAWLAALGLALTTRTKITRSHLCLFRLLVGLMAGTTLTVDFNQLPNFRIAFSQRIFHGDNPRMENQA
jgi:hypothetical protein